MNFNLKRPCKNCPFRNDVGFFMTPERRAQIAEALTTGHQTFACHNTVDYDKWDEAGEYRATGGESHCAGALIVLAKEGVLWENQMLRLAAALRLFNPDILDMDAPVFENMEEFADD
jgi:hypothetical protein